MVTISDFPAKASTLTVREIAGLARRTEEQGLDRFAVTDWPYYFDCLATMSACLAGTERVVVESLATTPFARNAEATACAFASMHEYSAGRVILGIGAGVEDPSSVWMPPWGHARPRPVAAVRELVELCRTMWRGEPSSTTGNVLRGSGLGLNFPVEGRLPVLIAARGPQMLRLAGEIADIVHIAPPFLGHHYIEGCLEQVREGARRAGRSIADLEVDLTVSASVGADREQVRETAKVVTAYGIIWMSGTEKYARERRHWQVPDELDVPGDLVGTLSTDWDMWSGEPLPPDAAAMIDDHVLDQFSIAGRPEECGERFRHLLAGHPDVTGLRLKLPPLTGPDSYPGYLSVIDGVGQAFADW
jgi:alkanesulfonate monooxygenase SsuD/methylene tetrahydromethanopterin reductase-like flavin-dependent oxidoreductase (luciferase family)